jgi:hypothetical protein
MTAISRPTTYDLLVAPVSKFKRWGATGKLQHRDYRMRYTGHARAMSRLWVQSVGFWGGGTSWQTPRPLFDFDHPGKGRIRAKQQTYYNFKSKNKLYNPKEFSVHVGARPWTMAERSYTAITNELELKRGALSLGSAAYLAHYRSCELRCPLSMHLGLLPVEMVLWARIFHVFLTSYALDLTLWQDMSLGEQRSFWKHEVNASFDSELFYSPHAFLKRPAVLFFEDDDQESFGCVAQAS